MNVKDAAKFLNITASSELSKLYILGIFICMLGLGYCSFFRSSKQADFIKVVSGVQEQCRNGCPAIPTGWRETNCVDNDPAVNVTKVGRACAIYRSNSSGLGDYFYVADNSNFYISHRYYSDSILEATGGQASQLVVMHYIKGKKEEVYRQ